MAKMANFVTRQQCKAFDENFHQNTKIKFGKYAQAKMDTLKLSKAFSWVNSYQYIAVSFKANLGK